MTKTLYVIQHVPFENPGAVSDWAAAAGWRLAVIHSYRGEALPNPSADLNLVVLGGPMSVHDAPSLPWLAQELRFIADAARAGGHILGICLGAQLLAQTQGGVVSNNPTREIGWFPVKRALASVPKAKLFAAWPDQLSVFHWHGEAFSLPPGAADFGSSALGAVQGFELGGHLVGLQFHAEVTPAELTTLTPHLDLEYAAEVGVQTSAAILENAVLCTAANAALADVLDRLFGRAGK